ncbi:MAG: NADH-quinone oxidoreductase subunit L [Dehalococcoidia bacterium]|nr:NADH-quinone oxidoreductase subunit L [Dehalococcoidia bacterium]
MTIGMEQAWLLPGLTFGAFTVLSLASLTGLARRIPGGGAWLSIAAALVSFVLFWPVAADEQARGTHSFAIPWVQVAGLELTAGMAIDPLTVLMLGLITFVALCVQVYSTGYMRGESRYSWYFAALSLFVTAMLGLVLADNYLLLYIMWELVGFCSYLLIGFYYDRKAAAEAAKKAFVTTRLGDVGLLIGILLLFRATGTFQMSGVFHAVETGAIEPATLSLAALLLFLGAMGKSAQFPFHVWLPDAMEGPTPVSALIHAATMVAAGVYLVARSYPLFSAVPGMLMFMTLVGLITTIMAAGIALVVTDIKKVIAYSTVSKLGFMVAVLGAGGAGFTAAIFYLVTHGFFKALLFLGAGSVIHATHRQDLQELGGLGRKMPLTASVLLIATLALAGLPPLSGFWSKDEALVALSQRGPLVYGLAILSVFLSAIYGARLWFRLFTGPAPTADHESGPVAEDESEPGTHALATHDAPVAMALPMLALAAMSVVGGVVALPAVGALVGMPQGIGSYLFFHEPEPFYFDAGVAVTSTTAALLGLFVASGLYWWRIWSPAALQARFSRAHALLERKFLVDEVYQWAIDHIVLASGRLVALFDRAVLNDAGVNGPGVVTVALSALLKYTQTGRLANYALIMVIGLLVLFAAAFGFAM